MAVTGSGMLPASARWDPPAVRDGAGVALIFAVPFSVLARLASDHDASGAAAFLSLLAAAGFVLGSGVAAWRQRTSTPYSHALVTAAGTFLAAQAVFTAVKLFAGGEVHWFAIFFNLSVVMGAGTIGGFLGSRLRSRGILPRP